MKNKRLRRDIIISLIIFLIIFLIIIALFSLKMDSFFREYMKKQVELQVEGAAKNAYNKFEHELKELENISRKLEVKDMKDYVIKSEKCENGIHYGILKIDGNALYGKKLKTSDFSGIYMSVRGNKAVSYCEKKGLVFSVPVLNGKNVKYVLYKLYEEDKIEKYFSMSCYAGKGKILIVNDNEEKRF